MVTVTKMTNLYIQVGGIQTGDAQADAVCIFFY